jgi:hypothetical protein
MFLAIQKDRLHVFTIYLLVLEVSVLNEIGISSC